MEPNLRIFIQLWGSKLYAPAIILTGPCYYRTGLVEKVKQNSRLEHCSLNSFVLWGVRSIKKNPVDNKLFFLIRGKLHSSENLGVANIQRALFRKNIRKLERNVMFNLI